MITITGTIVDTSNMLLYDFTVTFFNNTDKSLLQLVEEASESEPAESEKLRKDEIHDVPGGTVNTALRSNRGKLTKETKCDLAVITVKRAFSQCPNLTLLVSALQMYCHLCIYSLFERQYIFFFLFSYYHRFVVIYWPLSLCLFAYLFIHLLI